METIKAEKREITGKKVKRLRSRGLVPSVIYGAGKPSVPISIPEANFTRIFTQAGTSTLIDVDLTGEKNKVLITDVQYDPVTGRAIHADLKRIEAGEKMTANVPIETVGESAAVKSGEGILLSLLDEVEVECFPQDLPSEITIDISSLSQVGQGITIKDLPIDHGKVNVLGHEEDDLVLKIGYPQEEGEEVEVTEEEAVAGVETTEEREEGEEDREQKTEDSS